MTDHQRVIANTRARIGAILGLRTAVAVLSGMDAGVGDNRARVAGPAVGSARAAAVGTGGRGCGGHRRCSRCRFAVAHRPMPCVRCSTPIGAAAAF